MNYNTPGNVNDLTPALLNQWRVALSELFDYGVGIAMNEKIPPSEKSWFFNAIKEGTANTSVANIRWNAFPKRLLDTSASKLSAWRKADSSRDRHEEYCEWEVVRRDDKVVRVTFTTETPDYYSFLYAAAPDVLVNLYRRHVSPQVQLSDLGLINGKYNPVNKWNYPETVGSHGVLMHMGFGANTLGAAIQLSAEATWPSVDTSGNVITDEQGLIRCRAYGARERHSDPHIGAEINSLIRAGNEVSFAGPPGLYIDSIDFSRFDELSNGLQPQQLMKVIRGDKDHMMRIIFEAPQGTDLTLSDVKIDGEYIMFGGQIAETLTIRVSGIARKVDQVPPKIDCNGSSQTIAGLALDYAGARGTRKSTITYISSSE